MTDGSARWAPWLDTDACSVDRGTSALRLLCFPHAGASAVVYRPWHRALPASIRVLPVQLPGRATRIHEPPFRRVEPVVRAACTALRDLLQPPFALFGHSVGAAIAFELARVLEHEHGLRAAHLFVAGRAAPTRPRRRGLCYDLPTPAFVAAMRELNGLPAAILDSPEALEFFLPLLRADVEMSETYAYVPGPPLSCPITVLGGVEDTWVRREDLDAWAEQTNQDCRVLMLAGDHFFVKSAGAEVTRTIGERLSKATISQLIR